MSIETVEIFKTSAQVGGVEERNPAYSKAMSIT